ncbi:MAG: pilus assembly protein PilM, partial [Bacillota bacterium]
AEHPVAEHPVAERDQASNGAAPLPPRRSDYGPLTQLVPVLLSVSVVLFGFSLGVVTYYEWSWWQVEHVGRLWAAGAWTMALGFVVGFALLASGVMARRREAREEAEAFLAAKAMVTNQPVTGEGAPEVAATMATAPAFSAPAQGAPAVVLEPGPRALPPHRTNPAATLGRAFLVMFWIAIIAVASWLEINFEAEGSPFRYFALGGLAVIVILWWAAREAFAGLNPNAGAVVRARPVKPARERPARPEPPPRKRRFIMPESSLVKPAPVAAARPVEEATKPVSVQSVPERQPERPAQPAAPPPPAAPPQPAAPPKAAPPVKPAKTAPSETKPAKVSKVGGQGRTWVGLDIGSRTIKVVQVAPGRPHSVVINFASCPTPERSVKDSVIIKPTAVADAITELLDKAGIKQRRVIAALGGQAVILRQAQFPLMPPNELREALKWESEQHIPIPADDAIVDFTILGEISAVAARAAAQAQAAPGAGTGAQAPVTTGPAMQVLLVATQKRIVTGYTDVFESAKLKPIALEVDLLGVHRALQSNGYIDDEGRPVAILNIGAASAGLSLFANHSAQLTRTIPAGSDVFTQSIAEAFQETPAAAETLLREHGAKPLTPIARCVEPVVDELVLEIRRSLEFYLIKNRQHGIGQLFMVGGAAVLPGLAQTISDALNEALRDKNPGGQPIEVIVPDPSRRLPVAGAARARLAEFGPEYMQALGLALREESPQ